MGGPRRHLDHATPNLIASGLAIDALAALLGARIVPDGAAASRLASCQNADGLAPSAISSRLPRSGKAGATCVGRLRPSSLAVSRATSEEGRGWSRGGSALGRIRRRDGRSVAARLAVPAPQAPAEPGEGGDSAGEDDGAWSVTWYPATAEGYAEYPGPDASDVVAGDGVFAFTIPELYQRADENLEPVTFRFASRRNSLVAISAKAPSATFDWAIIFERDGPRAFCPAALNRSPWRVPDAAHSGLEAPAPP